jgi:SAM-dependent methyltransferase
MDSSAAAQPSTQEVIDSLRNSSDAYKVAAEREADVWGKHFSDPHVIKVREDDAKATVDLLLDRGRLTLAQVARNHHLTFTHGLSLACGSGRAERELLKLGLCESFVGVDIAPDALEEARRIASAESLNIVYERGDLNDVKLSERRFDVVVTQNCLHHVLELEHLAEQIWGALKPGGYLWIDDFIGETQFQWTDRRLMLVNAILDALPEKYRTSRLTGKRVGPYTRPAPGAAGSPFEAIRSAEIVPVFKKWFDVEWSHESNSLINLVFPIGTRAPFASDETGRALAELLLTLDGIFIQTDTLPPLAGQYLMRRRPSPTR